MEKRRDKRSFKRRRLDKISEDTITKKKDMMLNNPVVMKEIADGLNQDEALNFFIYLDDIIKENHQLKQDNIKMREVLEELQFSSETNTRIIKILLGRVKKW